MSAELRRYRFNPLEQRGLIAGLQAGQLAVIGAAALLAVGVLRSAPSGAGVLLAAAVLGVAAAASFWRVAGATPAEWAPVLVGWGWRRLHGNVLSDAPADALPSSVTLAFGVRTTGTNPTWNSTGAPLNSARVVGAIAHEAVPVTVAVKKAGDSPVH